MKLTRELGSYAQPGIIRLYGSFQTNGSSAPTVLRDGNSRLIGGGGSKGSTVRTSAGLYTVTLESGMPIPSLLINAKVSIHALAAPVIMANAYYVAGSYSHTTRSFQIAVLSGAAVPALTTGAAVTSNAVTLTTPGPILAVQATTATTGGVKTITLSGTPSTGQAKVTYDASGIPTITFATADAVTVTEYVQMSQGVLDPDSTVRIDFELVGSIEAPSVDPA